MRGRCRDLEKLYEDAESMQYELAEQLDISVGHFNKEADQLEREKEMKQHLEKSLLHCEGHIELLEEEKQELGERVEQLEGVNAQLREEMGRLQRELAEMEARFREELSLREEKIRELSVRLEDNEHLPSMSSLSRHASVIEKEVEFDSSDLFRPELDFTLPQTPHQQPEMAEIRLLPRGSLPSERKSVKKSTKGQLQLTQHRRTGREADKNTARKSSTAAQEGLKEIFMDRVRYRQEADRKYEAKLSEATSRLREENERLKREAREAQRSNCDLRREMGRLNQ